MPHRSPWRQSPRILAATVGLVTVLPLFIAATLAAAPNNAGTSGSERAQALRSAAIADLQWRMIGPFRGGRTRAVAGLPDQPGTFLIGAVNGGVWKSTDYGRTWRPVFDAQPTQSIGAIAVAPSDSRVIYVGSGEGLHRPDLSVGDGIYRSGDGGESWTHLGLNDAQQIPEMAVDPRDPNRVFAAVLGHPYGASAQRGIFRSSDGGAHWSNVLHHDDDTGGASVAIDPAHPDTVYAALWTVRSGPWEDNERFEGTGGGLFKSTDGGEHWRALKTGLPDSLSQVQIALAPSNPQRLYVTAGTTAPGDYSSATGLGVYRSDDGGEHFARITTDPRPALRIGGGDLPIIRVDPNHADVLYSASLVTVKSTDGGVSWTSLRGAPGGDDYQNLWINPLDSRVIALVSDQGAVVTVNGGETWSSWLNQPTAQLYHVGITPTFPYRVCSGQQESGSLCIASRGNDGVITDRDWHPVGVIEYGYVLPDPLDPNIIYGSGRNEVTRMDLTTGQVQTIGPLPLRNRDVRVDRTEPLFFLPQHPHELYYGADRLYSSSDTGQSWHAISPDLARPTPPVPASVGALHMKQAEAQRGVIYAASASALEDGLLWVGTDDGLIWRRATAGAEWVNVTPPPLTPWSKVTQIEASHFDPLTAYASVSRFRLDDLTPYVYRTRDGGRSWQLIVTGLPVDAPVNTVREDPQRRGLLFAGTEHAVWVSFDDGEHWDSLQLNLPHTSMRDLAVHGQDLILATHGRSFWILDDISPLRQIDGLSAPGEAALLKPAPAVRVQRDTNTDTPTPPDEPMGRNPPDGAIIDYYLAKNATTPVVLEILDAAGATVRRFSSTDPQAYTAADLAHELIPAYWIRRPQELASGAGMHRWVWDLHYPSPRTAQRGFPIAAVPGDTPQAPLGPVAAPGIYRVRLSIGAHHWEQPLQVLPDPRVKLAPEGYAQQLQLARAIAGALDDSTGALFEARSLRAQSLSLAEHAKPALAGRLKSFAARLDELLGTSDDAAPAAPAAASETTPAPRHLVQLNTDLASLYDQVVRADAAPTAPQADASGATISAWRALQESWRQLRGADTAALNVGLHEASLAALRAELAPPKDLDLADVE